MRSWRASFHELQDREQANYLERSVLHDTDDVVSSQGALRGSFTIDRFPFDVGFQIHDDDFEVATGTRGVEPRNTPTVFNAVFNFANLTAASRRVQRRERLPAH